MEQAVFLDLEIQRERVLVPAEKDAGGHGLDIHRRGFQDPAVLGGIFDDFFMEHLVFAPTGHGVKFVKMVGEGRHMEIAPDEVGGVAILFAGFEILADHELKKPDRVVWHALILNMDRPQCKWKWRSWKSAGLVIRGTRRILRNPSQLSLKIAPQNHTMRSTSRGVFGRAHQHAPERLRSLSKFLVPGLIFGISGGYAVQSRELFVYFVRANFKLWRG